MAPRKNTSLRLSDAETEALEIIGTRHNLKMASLLQRAARKYVRDYLATGPTILLDDEELPVGVAKNVAAEKSKIKKASDKAARVL